MILDHNASNQRSNELEALHPLGVCHSRVHSKAVTLDAGLVPTIWCPDEQGELVTHQLSFQHTEGESRRVILFIVSWLQFSLVIRHNIEAVVRVLHHSKLSVSQLADLIELAEGRGMNPILVLFSCFFHEFVGLFAIVAELAGELDVARAPVLLKLALEESNLYRRKQESLALLDLAGD